MGATPWHTFIPYHPDIEKAFRELQKTVFERGEYRKIDGDISFLDEIDFFESPDEVDDQYFPQHVRTVLQELLNQLGSQGLRDYLGNLNKTNRFRSIDDFYLLFSFCSDGSASNLDCQEISMEPGVGSLCTLTDEQLNHYFGTLQPTRKMIEQNENLWEDIPRGEAIFLTVYKNQTPDELYFAGYSAD